jgi:hypothetical protein
LNVYLGRIERLVLDRNSFLNLTPPKLLLGKS